MDSLPQWLLWMNHLMKMKFTGIYLQFLIIFSNNWKCRTQENQDSLQLPDIETPSDSRPPPPPVTRPPVSSRLPRNPPSDSMTPLVTRHPVRQIGTSSQNSPAPETPHLTTRERDSSPGDDEELETLDDIVPNRPHLTQPASTPSTSSTLQTGAGAASGSKQYFKGSSVIPGSEQKTHDMALLESVLGYMVDHQVFKYTNNDIQFINSFLKRRLGTINMTQIARDTRARHPLSFGSRPISEISKLAKTRINK